jgi:hypothetical protein
MPDEQIPHEDTPAGGEKLAPARVQLEQGDVLRLKVARLEAELAGERLEKARQTYATAARAQVMLAVEIGKKYGVDASQYDYDEKQDCLVLRQVRQLRQVGG